MFYISGTSLLSDLVDLSLYVHRLAMTVIQILMHVVEFSLVPLHDFPHISLVLDPSVLVLSVGNHQLHVFQSQVGVLHVVLLMIPASVGQIARVRIYSAVRLIQLLPLILILKRLFLQLFSLLN